MTSVILFVAKAPFAAQAPATARTATLAALIRIAVRVYAVQVHPKRVVPATATVIRNMGIHATRMIAVLPETIMEEPITVTGHALIT